MSELLAHDGVQYTDDSITPLGLLRKKEHERQETGEMPSSPSRVALSRRSLRTN